jgi:uncharacterized protein with GYD domain
MGGKIQLWLTMGRYDLVALSEFADDGAAQKFLYWVGGLGNVHTTTLKALDRRRSGELNRTATVDISTAESFVFSSLRRPAAIP